MVYANTFNNAFISDDVPAILENHKISQFFRFWPDPSSLFNSLSYLIAGYNPFIYHFISIILHSINTILVFLFLSLFFKTAASLIGASLFAIHPIHTEAVTWISGKPYLFLTFFILITYLLYRRAINSKSCGKKNSLCWYALSLLIFTYSIINTSYFLMLFPLLLILSDTTLGKWRRNWILWLPFIGVVIIKFILMQVIIPQRISFVINAINANIAKNPLIYISYSFYSHLWLLIWPVRLTLCHGSVEVAPFFYKFGIFSLIAIIPIIFLLIFTFRKAKELFFALGIFILFLSPTYSPMPVVSSFIAERYIYFPSIALSMAVAFLYEKYTHKYESSKRYLLAILIFVIFIYGIRTLIRNQDWKTPKEFWSKTLAISPNNIDARNNLGVIYFEEGNIKNAIEEYEKVIGVNPKYPGAYDNLAVAYMKMGDKEKAISLWEKALGIDPNYAQADFNLSMAYFNLREYSLAIKHCDEAIKLGYKVPPEFLKSLEPYRKK